MPSRSATLIGRCGPVTITEPLLQLAADHLSGTDDYQQFWNRRRNQLPAYRCYQSAA